jgi:hypothetical protein
MQRVPPLAASATPMLASRLVWTVILACTLPVAWALSAAAARMLVWRLQPGSVRIQQPSEQALSRLQADLGYSWREPQDLQAALSGDSSGATGRFAWLGGALLHLLAAEAAFRQQPDSANPADLEEEAQLLAAESALATKAQAASLPQLVVPSPGAKSRQLAAAKAAELYAACLAAAFVDAGGKLDAARCIFIGGSGAGVAAAAEDLAATPTQAAASVKENAGPAHEVGAGSDADVAAGGEVTPAHGMDAASGHDAAAANGIASDSDDSNEELMA